MHSLRGGPKARRHASVGQRPKSWPVNIFLRPEGPFHLAPKYTSMFSYDLAHSPGPSGPTLFIEPNAIRIQGPSDRDNQ